MREMNEHIETLIARYLSGEALPHEAMELEEWKQQHPDNLKHWEKSEQAYFLVRGEQNTYVDAAAMYRNVLAQLDVQKEAKVLSIDFRSLLYTTAYSSSAGDIDYGRVAAFTPEQSRKLN
jgi:ferric-dicitrate binding protein FerR (iron transport regulator)